MPQMRRADAVTAAFAAAGIRLTVSSTTNS